MISTQLHRSTTSTTTAVPAAGSGRAVVRLTARLVRRATLIAAASLAGYVALEMVSYVKAYPDAASRARISTFGEVGAARALQGIPHGVQTVGGFVAWDTGWIIGLIIGVWGILLATRLLRGDEDDDRAQWVAAAPVRAGRALAAQLAVLFTAALTITLAITITLLVGGADPVGCVLFGAGLTGFAGTWLAVAAVTAQVFGLRRRAVAVASAVLGATFVVRMVADGAGSRGWLRWVTPFGWMEELQPFAGQRWPVLALLAIVPVLLVAVAAVLRGRRDLGAGLVGGADRRPPRLRLLGSTAGYAWRSGEGVLFAWAAGLGAYAFVMGSMVKSMTDYLAEDEDLRRAMDAMGMGSAVTVDGFVGVMSVVLGVGFAVYGCWRIAAIRAEEAAGRAELVLSRRVTRTGWLLGQLAGAVVASAVPLGVSGAALWAGAASTGAELSFVAALQAVANTASVVWLFIGLTVLTLGIAPRLTAALPVSLVVAGYLLPVIGGPLELPDLVIDLSPFHHLAYVPAQPFAAAPAAWMIAIGVVAAVAGVAVFHRRDLHSD